jgi:cyclophilin family peptidyl-prolyl cis-trans isomerase
MTRSTTAPNASTATTAYYTCKVSAIGAQSVTITRTADGAAIGTASFDVPAPQVTMTVSNGLLVGGSMVITLAPDKTPITVDNFLAYVNSGFYDGTIFHRLQPGFVIQGGGYLPITTLPPVLKTGTAAPIPLEVNKGLSNVQWTIAMARTPAPDSATSQFFVNLVDNAAILDPNATSAGYAVFGTVTANTALVSAIAAAPCVQIPSFLPTALGCVPNPNMVITKAEQTR